MKVVSSEVMRELDRRASAEFEIPGDVLMDRAGYGVADVAQYLARMAGLEDAPVHLFAGRGNNGGDAFVAARYLKERGADVEVWLAGEVAGVGGDSLKPLGLLRSAKIHLHELPTKRDWDEADDFAGFSGVIVVDGILGTGVRGPARGPAAGAIRRINELGRRNFIVSIDVPSGLDADTGAAAGDTVKADVTVTMGLPKCGLLAQAAVEYVGTLDVVDIGIPAELVQPLVSDVELVAGDDMRRLASRRPRASHKGMFGHVLIVAGARAYAGAAIMAARAAVHSGVGLVTVLTPVGVAPIVAGAVPEAMVHPGRETGSGSLSADALEVWGRPLHDFTAVVAGPGMTACDETGVLVERLLSGVSGPLVLDADALNVLPARLRAVRDAPGSVILTPHPGEAARLLGTSVEEVQKDRLLSVRQLAERSGKTVVLKGAGTLIAEAGLPCHVNLTGNPGMAAGGMGDVLSGLMGGIAAQGLKPFDAARLAVYLHGRAGDNVSLRLSQAGMAAHDVTEEIPHVFRDVSLR